MCQLCCLHFFGEKTEQRLLHGKVASFFFKLTIVVTVKVIVKQHVLVHKLVLHVANKRLHEVFFGEIGSVTHVLTYTDVNGKRVSGIHL